MEIGFAGDYPVQLWPVPDCFAVLAAPRSVHA